MKAARATSGIRSLLLLGILSLSVLTGAVPAPAVTYAYRSPLSFKWAKASGAVDHYNVYVSVDGRPFKLLEEAAASSCRVDAADGRTYVVQVEAEDAAGRVGPMSDPSDRIVVFLNGSKQDTDGDAMLDAWEVTYGLNPFDPGDAGGDPDGDGLTNLDEFDSYTNPTDSDTDDDGIQDGRDPSPRDPKNGNGRPVADAGEDQELDPTVVTLDGSGSYDPDRDLLSYTWTQQEGPDVALSGSHTVSPAFLGTKSGDYLFELVVRDGIAASRPDEVFVTIRNVPPAADAGPDLYVDIGTRVVLDGSGSADPNGDAVSFSWTQISGTPVSLQGAESRTASFVPPMEGIYGFELVTSDGRFFSTPDEVEVFANVAGNSAPTADAGQDQTVKAGDKVTLDGSGSSDPDRDPLSYAWSQIQGPESVDLQGASKARARFDASKRGLYRFRLIVDDGLIGSAPDYVTVLVESATNWAPVAVIRNVAPARVGAWVSLDGTASYDPDGIGYLTYSWSQTSGPQVMLKHGDRADAGFYAVTEGVLAFELLVDDGADAGIPAVVEVEVLSGDLYRAQLAESESRSTGGDDAGGCSVGLGGSPQHEVDATDLGYVLTLFLPAIGAVLYKKRKMRARAKRGNP